MERIIELYNNFIKAITGTTSKMPLSQKILAGVIVILAIVGGASYFYFVEDENSQYLYVDLSKDDVTAISNFLAKSNFK